MPLESIVTLLRQEQVDDDVQFVQIALPIRRLIPARLRVERERLGIEAADIDDWLGLEQGGFLDAEDGRSELGATQLARLAALAFDLQYVLTGVTSDCAERIADRTLGVQAAAPRKTARKVR